MLLYKSVYAYGEAELTIEKSKFTARVSPVNSYEEAQAFVADIKQQYKNATHNVPAIICGPKQEIQWASDDGEPSGTSGLPMLKVAAEQGLTNLAIVVTRYFGGVKLGTGGLSRAYSQLAKLGIEAAKICYVYEGLRMCYEIDYNSLPKIQHASNDAGYNIEDVVYTDKVVITISCLLDDADAVSSMISNITMGKARLLSKAEELIKKIHQN